MHINIRVVSAGLIFNLNIGSKDDSATKYLCLHVQLAQPRIPRERTN